MAGSASVLAQVRPHTIGARPDRLHRGGKLLLRDAQRLRPVPDFVFFSEADPGAILRAAICKVVGHIVSLKGVSIRFAAT